MEYREIAKDIIITAKRKGIDEVEVLIIKEENRELSVRNGKIDTFRENISIDSRIKLIKNKSLNAS